MNILMNVETGAYLGFEISENVYHALYTMTYSNMGKKYKI